MYQSPKYESKIIKIIEETIGRYQHNPGVGKIFLGCKSTNNIF